MMVTLTTAAIAVACTGVACTALGIALGLATRERR